MVLLGFLARQVECTLDLANKEHMYAGEVICTLTIPTTLYPLGSITEGEKKGKKSNKTKILNEKGAFEPDAR